jgi:hypothetical protein
LETFTSYAQHNYMFGSINQKQGLHALLFRCTFFKAKQQW